MIEHGYQPVDTIDEHLLGPDVQVITPGGKRRLADIQYGEEIVSDDFTICKVNGIVEGILGIADADAEAVTIAGAEDGKITGWRQPASTAKRRVSIIASTSSSIRLTAIRLKEGKSGCRNTRYIPSM